MFQIYNYTALVKYIKPLKLSKMQAQPHVNYCNYKKEIKKYQTNQYNLQITQ